MSTNEDDVTDLTYQTHCHCYLPDPNAASSFMGKARSRPTQETSGRASSWTAFVRGFDVGYPRCDITKRSPQKHNFLTLPVRMSSMPELTASLEGPPVLASPCPHSGKLSRRRTLCVGERYPTYWSGSLRMPGPTTHISKATYQPSLAMQKAIHHCDRSGWNKSLPPDTITASITSEPTHLVRPWPTHSSSPHPTEPWPASLVKIKQNESR